MKISLSGMESRQGILQILGKDGSVNRQVYLDRQAEHYFEYLHPGEYSLKYMIDENGNGNWDPGNYLKMRHAEKVFIYQGTITIRSNWDQIIEWKLN